jgi:hypothetical protein
MAGEEFKVKQDRIDLWNQPGAYLRSGSRTKSLLSPEPNRTAHANV